MKISNLSWIIILLLIIISNKTFSQSPGDSLLSFIQANKSRASLYLTKNDSAIAKLNENKVMPLASTVKIMIAIEFAKQAASDVFDENEYVSLSEPEKYYIPGTDGDAHPDWIKYEEEKGHIKNDSVKLIDIARGMMMFSSNANSEYLMDLLGFDNVKNNIQLLGLENHTAIYPLVSSLFMYQNPKKVKEDKIIKEIKDMDDEQYSKFALYIHNQIKNDSTYKLQFRPLDNKMQKLWSDRLPASTAKEYVQLCSIINNRKYFDANTYGIIADVLETIMENPKNMEWLKHAGMKGGSTMFVLTKALYATMKDGTKIEMAYFFNDLTADENHRLQGWMNDFELKTLSDDNFRKKIKF